MATSAPVPMAIPRSASGEGRRVVDAVADHGHDPTRGLQSLDRRPPCRPGGPLPGSARAGSRPVARRPRPSCGRRRSPATPRCPASVSDRDGGLGRFGLDRVADRDEPGRRPVDGDERDGPPGAPASVAAGSSASRVHAALGQQARLPTRTARAPSGPRFDRALDAGPGDRREAADRDRTRARRRVPGRRWRRASGCSLPFSSAPARSRTSAIVARRGRDRRDRRSAERSACPSCR